MSQIYVEQVTQSYEDFKKHSLLYEKSAPGLYTSRSLSKDGIDESEGNLLKKLKEAEYELKEQRKKNSGYKKQMKKLCEENESYSGKIK